MRFRDAKTLLVAAMGDPCPKPNGIPGDVYGTKPVEVPNDYLHRRLIAEGSLTIVARPINNTKEPVKPEPTPAKAGKKGADK